MDPFSEKEEKEGVRWNWSKFPSTKLDASSLVLPLGALYTPLKDVGAPALPENPVLCKGCKAVANPHCRLDPVSRLWVCPFCLNRNPLPSEFLGALTPGGPVPPALSSSTVEYILPGRPAAGPPVFFYCMDTCVPADEMEALKDSVVQSLCLLPEDCYVGLITFGTFVTIWELGFGELHKSYVLNGTREYTPQEVREYLCLHHAPSAGAGPGAPGAVTVAPGVVGRFLVPLRECELALTSAVEELCPDAWPVKPDTRPLRCTGTAMDLCVTLLQLSGLTNGGRLMIFNGGAPTKGPGAVVSLELKEHIRQHPELTADQAPHYAAACKFYKGLADRLVQHGFACDIFACCLDQTGLMEMSCCITATGGACLMVDTFRSAVFKQSFHRLFATTGPTGGLNMAFNATMEIQCSRGTRISGIVGPCSSLNKMSPCVDPEGEIGLGKTCAWQMSALTNTTTFGIFFDVNGSGEEGAQRFVQIITSYQHISGEHRLRVATLAHEICASASPTALAEPGAFDQ
eukprot:RCo051123